MATSGTVATTVIDTAKLLEHACRRCGMPASAQTPEVVEIGKQNLYLILLNLSNRGLNLWCVEKNLIGLEADKATYTLPDGTIRTLDVLYSIPSRVTGTDTVAADSITTEMSAATKIVRWGFKLDTSIVGTMTLQRSDDGVTFVDVDAKASDTFGTDWYWYDLDPSVTSLYWRVISSVPITVGEFVLASAVRDLPMTQFSRNDYAAQPYKDFTGSICTNYIFEKTLWPTLTLWPVPNNGYDHLSVWRHRYAQDVGSLTEQIEVPQQWMEAIVWQLASRLAFEITGIPPDRRTEVIAAANAFLAEAELGESDNAPIFWVPGIGCYNR